MDIKQWKAKNNNRRNYAHFDNRISLGDVWSYINNPKNIEKHSFYPFIHYIQTFNKYTKNKGLVTKERELCYSAHIDRCIFQLYGYKLNQLYNLRVEQDGIGKSAIAYRDNLGKNNIHFAKQAIDYIREKESCFIIIGDFTKFFDNLDHKYLKKMLVDLLEIVELPSDYYAVYKNITKFSTWDLKSILDINGLPESNDGIKKLNKLERALSLDQFKKYKKLNVKKNDQKHGIPQGSPISAVLSNIYMLEFDKILNDFICHRDGLYMRYCDDFLIVLPKSSKDVFKEHFSIINNIIKSTPKLNLQPDKSQVFRFKDNSIINCNNLVLEGIENGKNFLNYLGFTFDGSLVAIRDKTISKYYYRMYRKLKTVEKNHGRSKYGHKISCNNIYEKYSIKGANVGKGNFISYVRRAEIIFGKNEAINRATKNHMQKIRRRLNFVK
ncbi:antiviral reverse transcriptase Drt2 [Desulfosporosinus hippei]|uniref:Reverse transcriptase (RNA-dependent DNA polymerase) n=1 Tax=Desulfosporosinus hippei DSM 8344 TaxID=1121419 RepID=A0A1G8L3B3_9FIRM|nr:antiviral reverse transcriptase Drt2 [Desulfosporosinus hippei]SDI50145.1 Reverse transcriptase (RNA-dependent DNA polymerase) [Desulfosporosinus hippei DSM 8344]